MMGLFEFQKKRLLKKLAKTEEKQQKEFELGKIRKSISDIKRSTPTKDFSSVKGAAKAVAGGIVTVGKEVGGVLGSMAEHQQANLKKSKTKKEDSLDPFNLF